MQTLTNIYLYSSALKTIIARFISLFDLLVKNETFSKYQASMAYCVGQKLSDFHTMKYVAYKLQTAAHVAYMRDNNFFSQHQSWVGLSFSYSKCSNPQNEASCNQLMFCIEKLKKTGFLLSIRRRAQSQSTELCCCSFRAKRVLRHPRRLGLWVGFKSGREVGRQDGLPKVSSVTRSSWSCC